MDNLAVALLGFFAIGYFVLGGADLGTGMVMPFLGRTDHERRLVITSIAPFFLGNEVWLVGAAGILAGAFPDLESTLLHGLFLAFVALLTGWVIRDMGLWLRGRVDSRTWRGLCDTAVFAGSWTVVLSWGAIFGKVLAGQTDGSLSDPSVYAGMAVAAILGVIHGLAFASMRLTGRLRQRAQSLAGRRTTALPFLTTSAAVVALGIALGVKLSPTGAVAAGATLDHLLPPVLVVTPLLVAAQAWVWRIFRRRVTEPMYL